MSKARVHNLFVSMDGFAAGDHITLEKPIGDARALFAHFDGRFIHGFGPVDAPFTLDRALTSTWGQGIGAEIMGRGKFGPQTGTWTDDGWVGWWGDEPPFRTPVFVLTHHARDSIAFENGTVFHFVDASPAEALALASEAANGQDVRIGGGPTTVRSFLEADLIDVLHIVTIPVVLGRGTPLWEGLAGVEERFDTDVVASGGITHHLWNRKPR
ncbi:dihydrofolate reductase family protein [Knoellia subterranea]|uniref:DNA-binding protein n=1 Tax=Knoellia subterranea KCTC 19937 TaxID=1385521 RepID=A0A0A0JK23_9MICO|nr:dihydrofolate reductase family protein [Knoellia subterranea]KGN37089.1 DNA-binding protein [Knoellia subterranea KCTC 19937]